MKIEIEAAYGSAERLFRLVDANNLHWKPDSGTNWMTMGQLLRHVSQACGVGCRGFVTGDWSLPGGKSMEELSPAEMLPPAEKLPSVDDVGEAMRLLQGDRDLALGMIEQAGEDGLANREIAAPWLPEIRMPLGHHILRMIQHLEKHKSQLFYYLKLQGQPVNTGDLWG
ncbi:MAG TPA: DinB family protein [Terracidiphilus sp.]|nr:DinB family protein [Terracidiphilus sp.]